MDQTSRIYVAGHRGLVGSALLRRLHAEAYSNLITSTHAEVDLERKSKVQEFFAANRPEYVFLAAAKVGGIRANSTYPVDFLLRNLRIQNNVIEASWQSGVKGLIFLGSSCIYPKLAPQPLREEYLLSGALEPTNEPYAVAKIAGIELCEAFNRQYDTRFLSVMPTNLYGPNDNYDIQNSHVLAAFIRKFHLAKLASRSDWEAITKDELRHGPIPRDLLDNLKELSCSTGHARSASPPRSSDGSPKEGARLRLWGTGSPRREFLHSDDLADACIFLMQRIDSLFSNQALFGSALAEHFYHLINIGCGVDLTIRQLGDLVSKIVGYDAGVEWDSAKPDGTPQKLLDVNRLASLGWNPAISLEDGISSVYRLYAQDD
jgi:GDP-L-fucose synthase